MAVSCAGVHLHRLLFNREENQPSVKFRPYGDILYGHISRIVLYTAKFFSQVA
jgi:hypothetical protein